MAPLYSAKSIHKPPRIICTYLLMICSGSVYSAKLIHKPPRIIFAYLLMICIVATVTSRNYLYLYVNKYLLLEPNLYLT